MNAADILRNLHDDLANWQPDGVARPHLSVAVDPFDILERLFDGPRRWRIVLHWAGEAPTNPETPEAGIVDHTIEVYVARHHGLSIDKGRSQTIATRPDGEPTLMALRTLVDSRLRSYTFDTSDESIAPHLEYQGTDSIAAPDGVLLAAYRARYRITATTERIEYREPA